MADASKCLLIIFRSYTTNATLCDDVKRYCIFCKSLFPFLFVLTTCHREIYSNACLILFNSKNTLTLTLTQKNSIVQFFV